MTKATIKVIFDKTAKITQSLSTLSHQRVMAGVPADKGLRKGEEGPINNAGLMYLHENGAPEAHLPARPVVHPAIRASQKDIVSLSRQALAFAFKGADKAATSVLNAIGLVVQNAMRKRITDGPFIPLAPSTLRKRKRDGIKGEKPLIRTGQLRQALTYVIRKR